MTDRSAPLVLERDDRVVLRVSGRDPVRMLQGLVTNDLAHAPEDAGVYAAFLRPKGRMVADATLVRHGSAVLVETAAAAMEGLRSHLRKYVPPLFARVEDDSGWGVLGVYGGAAASLAGAVASEDLLAEALRVDPMDLPADRGRELLVPRDLLLAARDLMVAAGARPATHEELEVLRIEAGYPRWGAELDETVIPLEAGLLQRAISTTKGCYTGQEVIIRILHRGHVNRHLRGLLLGDAAVPAPGTELRLPGDARSVGRVTSACRSARMAQTIALAYLRREVEPTQEVLVGSSTATVVELPFGAPNDG